MQKITYIVLLLLASSGLWSQKTICVDPGHGYGDKGEDVDGRTTYEIETNVAVGLYLRDTLLARGYHVIMTRENNDTGSWLSLTQRAEIADFYESERLLSIHCNAGGGNGTETFWSRRNTSNYRIDKTFSDLVQYYMTNIGEMNSRRSVEDITYFGYQLGVLKGATHGCLNEIGFVDTPSNLEKLLNEQWRQTFAQAYAMAIDSSFNVDYPPSGVREVALENIVYPNPFTDKITLEINSVANNVSIQLITISGELMYQENISGQARMEITTRELQPGIYLLRYISGNTVKTSQLVKIDG